MEPMTTKEILIKINNIKKGTWVNLIKVKKLTDSITKYTQMTIRLGVDYSHMKEGKEKPEPLPWGKWLITNLVIEHKGNLYLRVANAYTKNAKSWYLKNGKEIDKSMVVHKSHLFLCLFLHHEGAVLLSSNLQFTILYVNI